MSFEKEIEQSKILEARALEKCNSEPIATPGFIQSYGALLAFDFTSLKVSHASENIGEYLSFPLDAVLGSSIRDLFDYHDYHTIANIASHSSTFVHRERVKTISLKNRNIDVSLYKTGDSVVLELIPEIQQISNLHVSSHLKWTLDRIRKLKSVDQILNASVHALKDILQFDRVVAYKFHADSSGEVVAEHNNGKMDSYLGLRFPAMDIPQIARDMLLKLSIRHIQNTADEGLRIMAAHDDLPPLSMVLGMLRANSPIHNQYLRNMEVSTTVTLPIIIKDKLWGLFSLHNHQNKKLTSEATYAAELLGQLINTVLEQVIQINAEAEIKKLHLEGEGFITLNKNPLYLQTFWKDYAPKLMALIPCDGVAYKIDQQLLVDGDCPNEKAIEHINENLKPTGDVYHSADIDAWKITGLQNTKGLLSLKISDKNPEIRIFFFRNELQQKIRWAGNPKKDVVVEKSGVRLHPRSSFEHFSQLNKDQSELWSSETVALAEIALDTFKKAVEVERASSERLKLVVQELNHRLRNILTLVRSISRQTYSEGLSINSYIDALESRILALANANKLLTASSYNSVDLRTLLLQVILAVGDHKETLVLDGPPTKLASDIIPTLVLIVHELTTNAVKYGSLAVKNGKLKLNWKIEDEGLILEWKETDGPKVVPPEKIGFGTTIIKNAIAYEFSGASEIFYDPEGLYVKFLIPKYLLGNNKGNIFVMDQVKEAALKNVNVKPKNANILILEDDYVNAHDMSRTLLKSNVTMVNMFSNQKDALDSIDTIGYDLALLDVNLKNETCIDVAQKCEENNIPFYYITGYGSSFLEENTFPKAPVILKPIDLAQLTEIINPFVLNSNDS